MGPLPNNRFKLPFLVLCAGVCVVMAATGRSLWLWVTLAMLSLINAAIVATGHNPWWLRDWFDRR